MSETTTSAPTDSSWDEELKQGLELENVVDFSSIYQAFELGSAYRLQVWDSRRFDQMPENDPDRFLLNLRLVHPTAHAQPVLASARSSRENLLATANELLDQRMNAIEDLQADV